MATEWICPTCTFANAVHFSVCSVCRIGHQRAAKAPGSSGSSNNRSAMTPTLLSQTWQSQYGTGRISGTSITAFSQPSLHVFSNYAIHPPVHFDIPPYCHAAELTAAGHRARITFRFAEAAIMACKAALFRDYATFDALVLGMASSTTGGATVMTSRKAKRLGRAVSPFDQRLWDAHRCSIARDVAIAKARGWDAFRAALLSTGNDLLAECTLGDRVWGTALDVSDGDVNYPCRWRGLNILGWSLMEARDEVRREERQRWQRELRHSQVATASAPPMPMPMNCIASTAAPATQLQLPQLPLAISSAPPPTMALLATNVTATVSKEECNNSNPHSIKHLAAQYSFGPNAFGPMQQHSAPGHDKNARALLLPDLSSSVKSIVESSMPEARHLRGERGNKPVTTMLTDIYRSGLFMHGPPTSSVNRTIVPAFRYILSQLERWDAQDARRRSMVRSLVEACQDCQQVQARTILRMYGDLTCQSETWETQLRYSLVPYKEAAMQILVSKYHSHSCDYDHRRVTPERQRAHLWSGYVVLVGEALGLDGVGTAKGDRFLNGSLDVIRNVHCQRQATSMRTLRGLCGTVRGNVSGGFGGGGGSGRSGVDDEALKQTLLKELTQNLSVQEWLTGLLCDINNQSTNADRTMDRSCVFKWAAANMDGDFKYRIFYDDTRAEEYSDLDPKVPNDDSKYEPFFSPIVLVEMLVKAGMLQPKL